MRDYGSLTRPPYLPTLLCTCIQDQGKYLLIWRSSTVPPKCVNRVWPKGHGTSECFLEVLNDIIDGPW